MKVSEELQRTADKLKEMYWRQGDMYGYNYKYQVVACCIEGACQLANRSMLSALANELCEELYEEGTWALFNDASGRTKDECVEALEHAAKVALERGL